MNYLKITRCVPIASVLDLSWVYGELSAPHLSTVLGRLNRSSSLNDPDADPRLRLRPAVGAFALSREVRVNLAYRWFCGLSIEDRIPDHSVFSREPAMTGSRDSDIFRQVFERVVEACISAGLVGGKEFAVDGEPDRGGRQQSSGLDPRFGSGSKSAILKDRKPSCEGVYGNPRRRGVLAASPPR